MEKSFAVRTEMVLATIKQWPRIKEISVEGIFNAEPGEFLQTIGLVNFKTEMYNEEEKEFSDLLHSLAGKSEKKLCI